MSVHNTGAAGEGSQLGLGDSVYQRLLKERIIWLGGEVRDDNANAICAQLLLLAAEDPDRDIYLYINSPGGSVTAGMAIYDTMQYIKPDVVTVGMGLAASMGQFLLTVGRARQALHHASHPRSAAPAPGWRGRLRDGDSHQRGPDLGHEEGTRGHHRVSNG